MLHFKRRLKVYEGIGTISIICYCCISREGWKPPKWCRSASACSCCISREGWKIRYIYTVSIDVEIHVAFQEKVERHQKKVKKIWVSTWCCISREGWKRHPPHLFAWCRVCCISREGWKVESQRASNNHVPSQGCISREGWKTHAASPPKLCLASLHFKRRLKDCLWHFHPETKNAGCISREGWKRAEAVLETLLYLKVAFQEKVES